MECFFSFIILVELLPSFRTWSRCYLFQDVSLFLAPVEMRLPFFASYAAAKSLQSCPTLCDPIDSSPPGSPVPGILQAGALEWVAISFSNVWKWKVKVKSLSHVRFLATPWTAAYQAPPSMGFSRQEYWSGLPLPSPSEFNYKRSKSGQWPNSLEGPPLPWNNWNNIPTH